MFIINFCTNLIIKAKLFYRLLLINFRRIKFSYSIQCFMCFDKYLNHKKIVFLSKEANVNQRLNLKKQGFKFSTQLFMVFNFLEFSLHHFIICLY
ncbi:hypothetical protein pb186bvf_010036 [Paramecium bursaria]